VLLVGLAETAVKESVHRVERALLNSGYRKPSSRVVINLAPADLRKDAAAFDLPIALGLLAGTGQIDGAAFSDLAVVGELALDGSTRPIKGALSIAMTAAKMGLRRLILPSANAKEAAVVGDIDVYPVDSLAEAVGVPTGELAGEPCTIDVATPFGANANYPSDCSDVRGLIGSTSA